MEQKKSAAVILGLTDSGERIPSAAGRISTQPGTACEIFAKSTDGEKNASLIGKVTSSGHNSTIEHTVFNLAFENVSVFAEQFLIEFRLASFTVKSRRYVDFADSGYYIPDSLTGALREKYTAHMDRLFRDYARLCELGVPKEDARFVLPYCLHSNFYCTVNAREFLNMLTQMLYGRGAKYPELKTLGESLLAQAKNITPGIMTDFEKRAQKKAEPTLPLLDFVHTVHTEEQKVALLGATPDAAKTVTVAALTVSDGDFTVGDAFAIAGQKENRRKMIRYLLDSPRPRALENVNYTYAVRRISLSCLTHFARHRMQSIQIPDLANAKKEFVLPETVRQSADREKIYTDCFSATAALKAAFTEAGVEARELVYLALSGNTIDIITTMNARELLLFFKLRCCNRAQWEIRDYADEMLRLARQAEPEIFQFFGPSCFVGACPEGRMSCGKQKEVREKYLAL
ncbi:MAG: FAD-dependent thymidylate synthase [Clostridia bacterium]|nr:FAD-dependent thymidylate synthase [Clostridia bacterium]